MERVRSIDGLLVFPSPPGRVADGHPECLSAPRRYRVSRPGQPESHPGDLLNRGRLER
jgi:hypothetical protein